MHAKMTDDGRMTIVLSLHTCFVRSMCTGIRSFIPTMHAYHDGVFAHLDGTRSHSRNDWNQVPDTTDLFREIRCLILSTVAC